MPDVVMLGESMIRLSTPGGEALERARSLRVEVAGAESNTAVGLSRMGVSVGWISRLANNGLGRRITYDLKANGVDISRVLWADDGRVGTYYLETGSAPRPSRIVYDRAGSAVAHIDPDEIDWAYVREARLVHLTGITPALSANCRALVERAIVEAKATGKSVSFDVNFRGRLWSPDEARACLDDLLPGVDILLCGRGDAGTVFGLADEAEACAQALSERFATPVVVVTDDERGAVACVNGEIIREVGYDVDILDPIGAGDAFAAGFLAGYLEEGVTLGLAYGNAMAALKLTYHGDLPWSTREDVLALIERGSRRADDVIR